MKMIKILQGAVVAMFVLMICVGLAVLFWATEKMEAYLALIGGLFPIFLAQVIPALVGSPLTELLRAKAQAIKPAGILSSAETLLDAAEVPQKEAGA